MFAEFIVSFIDSASEAFQALLFTVFGLVSDMDGVSVSVSDEGDVHIPVSYSRYDVWNGMSVHVESRSFRFTFRDKDAVTHLAYISDILESFTKGRDDIHFTTKTVLGISICEDNSLNISSIMFNFKREDIPVPVRCIVAKQMSVITDYSEEKYDTHRLSDIVRVRWNNSPVRWNNSPEIMLEYADRIISWCNYTGRASEYPALSKPSYSEREITTEVLDSIHSLCLDWIRENHIPLLYREDVSYPGYDYKYLEAVTDLSRLREDVGMAA